MIYTLAIGWSQQDNMPFHKIRIISNWFIEHDSEVTVLKWPPQSSDFNPITHIWVVVEQETHIMDVQLINLQNWSDAS